MAFSNSIMAVALVTLAATAQAQKFNRSAMTVDVQMTSPVGI